MTHEPDEVNKGLDIMAVALGWVNSFIPVLIADGVVVFHVFPSINFYGFLL